MADEARIYEVGTETYLADPTTPSARVFEVGVETYLQAPSTGATLRVFDGATFVDAPALGYTGATFAGTARFWNGAAWVPPSA